MAFALGEYACVFLVPEAVEREQRTCWAGDRLVAERRTSILLGMPQLEVVSVSPWISIKKKKKK